MCVIYSCGSALPDDAELRRGSETNTDGAGVAWLNDGLVHWQKDLEDWKKVKAFIEEEKLEFPLAIHFRSASVGGKTPSLAHPFPIGKGAPYWLAGSAPEVLFHNGHISSWEENTLAAGLASKEPFPLGPWSDSRALAWLVHLKGPGIIRFISGQSRVLIFQAKASTWEGQEYDPTSDHFTFYGPGWVHKEDKGYSQSVDTYERYSKTPGRWAGYDPRLWERDEEDAEEYEACQGNSKSGEVVEAGLLSGPRATAEYVWTMDELTKILTQLEKENKDAKLAAGV